MAPDKMLAVWRVQRLLDLVDFRNGKPIKPGQDGLFPAYGSAGVIGKASNFLYEDAIILGRVGAYCGSVFHYKDKFWASDNTIVVECKDHISDTRFLYYLLQSANLRRHAGGAAQPLITHGILKQLEFRVPPVSAQRRIASILGRYDSLIDVNCRRMSTLAEIRRRIFDEWFVELRFPGHEKVAISTDELGPIPDGWRRCELREVARVNRQSVKPIKAPTTICYVDITSVSPDSIDEATEIAFSEAPGRARRQVTEGSIIWSTVRPNRRSHALVLDPPSNMIVSTGFAVVDATAVPFSFLYEAVTTDFFVGYLTNHATGSAYPAVTGETFERALLLVPPKKLLDAFHHHAEPLLRLADKLRRANRQLAAARDLLLPRLVSGELSIAAAEREIEQAA
jgi:type I restriction enzyme S subunit